MGLPYKIDTNDLIKFVKVYNHECSGKEWSVDSFRTALTNWVNPTKIASESKDKPTSEKSGLRLQDVMHRFFAIVLTPLVIVTMCALAISAIISVPIWIINGKTLVPAMLRFANWHMKYCWD